MAFLRMLIFAAMGAGCALLTTFLADQSPWVTTLAPGAIFGVVFAVVLGAMRRVSFFGACFWGLVATFAYGMALFIFIWTVAQNIYPLMLSWPLVKSGIGHLTGIDLTIDAKVFTRVILSIGGMFAAWFGVGILIRQHKRLTGLANAGWLLFAVCAGSATLGLFMTRPDDLDNLLFFYVTTQALFAAALGWTLPPRVKSKGPPPAVPQA